MRRRPPRRRARFRHDPDRRALPRSRSLRLGARLRARDGDQAHRAHGRRASRHGDAAGGRKDGLEPRPHQPRSLCAQHRQRLVDGGVRPVQQRHLDRRCRTLSADGRIHPGDQGPVDRSRFQFRRNLLPRACAGGADRRGRQGRHAGSRRHRRQGEPSAISADLCCQPFAARQGVDCAARRRLVRRVPAWLSQFRREYRAHGGGRARHG